MVPPDGGVPFQFGIFKVEVQAAHLVGRQSTASTEASTAATAGKSHVVGVVGVHHSHQCPFLSEYGAHDSFGIAVLGSHAEVHVGKGSLVHAGLDAEVEHRFLVAVVDAGDAGQVALLVVGLDVVDDGCRQVFHGRLGVAGHKLLAVEQDFLHLLAVDGDFAVVVDLCARQLLHQFLNHRALGGAVGGGVIDEGVFLQGHLGGLGGHLGALQHDGIGTDDEIAEGNVLAPAHRNVAGQWGIAHTGELHNILAVGRGGKPESAVLVAHGTGNKRTVGF